jgi:alkylation response protein AidB-like acyl-CoA dehydrogenase
MIFGTEEQKLEHLPKIARNEIRWAQGYSEPGSGSDLASLQTRAVREGDDFVINGQKIWTSGAMHADWLHVLTRTDPAAPKHRGISYFMMPADTPGITIRALTQITGASEFAETFFEDVRVPAANMIGEENRGWYVAATTLDFERSGVDRVAAFRGPYAQLREVLDDDESGVELTPSGRGDIADIEIEAEVARLIGYRVTWMQASGAVPNYEASMSKVFGSEMIQRDAQRASRILGQRGMLRPGSPYAVEDGVFCQVYLWAPSRSILAGTSEIQRNIIATRGLGLPRG